MMRNSIDVKKNEAFFRNKQRGATLENFIFWLVAASLVGGLVVILYAKAQEGYRIIHLKSDVIIIIAAIEQYGGNNKTGISMSTLCSSGYLTKSICGTSNDGSGTNPFGGDYEVKANANNSRADIKITSTGDRTGSIADTLAPLSFDNCSVAKNCNTISENSVSKSVTLTR